MPCGLVESEARHGGGGQERLHCLRDSTGATADCSTEHFPGILPWDSQEAQGGGSYPPHFPKGETEVWGGMVTCPQKAPSQVATGLGPEVRATA